MGMDPPGPMFVPIITPDSLTANQPGHGYVRLGRPDLPAFDLPPSGSRRQRRARRACGRRDCAGE